LPPSRRCGAAGAIDATEVTQKFGAATIAVNNVSLAVQTGQFVSIIGPSGCGKTTFLNLIAGLLPLTSGQISISGSRPKAGRQDVAYMLARDSLLPWRSTLGNAEFGAEVRGMDPVERRSRAKDLLAQVGLKGFEDVFPKALSQGMRQRVALARTFCMDAQVLLMDEPFGALDAQTKIQLWEVLLRLWSRERRTVVLVTHDLGEAISLSDRVVVMSARPGKVIADIDIGLARPRSARALQKDHRFHELYAEVWGQLEAALEVEQVL